MQHEKSADLPCTAPAARGNPAAPDEGSNPAIETSRPTVDELLRRAVEWCGRHPGAELLTTYHALARRYGVTTENATKDADPAGGRLPIGEPTGADRRGWPIKQEPAPIDFGPEEQRRRGLAVGVQRRARVAKRDREILRASAGGATQRALAERFGLSRSSIRHVLDRHQAQRGRVATCGQRRQAAALTIRRDCRVAWRTWADASPTTRGPVVRRNWAMDRRSPREPFVSRTEAPRIDPTATRSEQIREVAEWTMRAEPEPRRRQRNGPTINSDGTRGSGRHRKHEQARYRLRKEAGGANRSDLPGVLTGRWNTETARGPVRPGYALSDPGRPTERRGAWA